MKHMRYILAAMLFSLACATLHANKVPGPPADAQSMAGAWIGPLSATFHPYIRLDLDASGKGFLLLPSCTPDKDASIYRVLGTTFSKNFKVKFLLEPVDRDDPQMRLVGNAEPKGLRLTLTRVDNHGSTWHWKANLLREVTVVSQIHTLQHVRNRLHAAGRGAN